MLTKIEINLIVESLEIYAGECLEALKHARKLKISDKAIVSKYKKIYKLIEKL